MTPLSAPELLALTQIVTARTGISLVPHGKEALERAARRVFETLSREQSANFLSECARGGPLFERLIDALTVGETYFFRNPEHFALVRERLLPELRGPLAPEQMLRVWSAGCASGEETYSLAILLQQEGLLGRAEVYGTDISSVALARARQARYRDWSFRGVDLAPIERHFEREELERTVCAAVRTRVVFQRLNLAQEVYAPPFGSPAAFQLIFCRNVLMYLDSATVQRVEQQLFSALAPGGYLVLGPSDPMFGGHSSLEVLTLGHMLYYRRPLPRARERRSSRPPARPLASDTTRFVAESPIDLLRQTMASSPKSNPPDPLESAAPPVRDEHAPGLADARANDAAATVRAVWQRHGPGAAELACVEAARSNAHCSELHYLHALALLDLGRSAEALAALRRVLYLDPALTIAHFTLGLILEQSGDLRAARRAYRNACDGCRALPEDAPLRYGDGVSAASVAEAAARALAAIEEH